VRFAVTTCYAPDRSEGGNKRCLCPSICPSVCLSARPSRTLRIILKRKDLSCPNLEGRFSTLDATRIPVSRSNGQRSVLEVGGGIPYPPNPVATPLVFAIISEVLEIGLT